MSILTRWHRIRDAADKGALTLVTSATVAKLVDDLPGEQFDRPLFRETLALMDGVPRFVLSPSVVPLVRTKQAVMSVSDMDVCGVLSLPFPTCVVEFEATDTHYSVQLWEASEADRAVGVRWWAQPVAGYAEEGRDVCMAFPGVLGFDLATAPPSEDDAVDGGPPEPGFAFNVRLPDFMTASDDDAETYVTDTVALLKQRCMLGFLAAVLLPQTLGVVREEVAVKPGFNRQRAAKGRAAIPAHTVLKVGSYVDSSGGSHGVGDGATEVFLRRAHRRRVPVGPGRVGRRWTFFPAQVVGYLPDGRKPTLSEMFATRAAKPYLLK